MYTWGQKTLLALNFKKNLSQDIFPKNIVLKESFFFVASDVVSIIYNKPCICIGDEYLWKGWDYSDLNNLF